MLADAEPVVQAAQRRRRPPVPPARQAHEGGDEGAADHEGVDEDGEGEAEAEQLDEPDLGGPEGDEHDGDQQRGRGHDPTGALEAHGHRAAVVAGPVVLLLDARQQEHLVVHGEAEGDAEHQDRRRGVRGADGGEVEDAGQVPVLEHPDHGAEGRRQAEHVQQEGLERDDDGAEQQEQQHEGGHGDQGEGHGHRVEEGRLGVDELGGQAGHGHVGEGGLGVADPLDEGLALGRVRLDLGDDREVGGVGPGEPLRQQRVRAEQAGSVGVDAGGGVDAGDVVEARQAQRPLVDGRSGGGCGRVADARGDDGGRPGLDGGELVADHVGGLAHGRVGGQHPVVGQPELDAQERQAEEQQDGDHRGRHGDRAGHDGGRRAVPGPGLDRPGLAAAPDGQGVDAPADDRQEGGQDRDRVEPGQEGDGHARVGEGAQEAEGEHQEGEQRHGHRPGREGHGPARGADGAVDGHGRLVAAVELLPVPGHDEEGVVDGQAEAHGRRQVQREHRHVCEPVDRLEHEERRHHRQGAHGQGEQRGDHAPEDEQEQQQRDRDGDQLGPHEVGLDGLPDRVEHLGEAGDRDVELPAAVEGDRALELGGELGDPVVDLVLGPHDAGEHERLVARPVAQRRDVAEGPVRHDVGHVALGCEPVGERGPGRRDGCVVDGGGPAGHAVGGVDEQDHVGRADPEGLEQRLVGPERLRVRIVEAARGQLGGDVAAERSGDGEEDDGGHQGQTTAGHGEACESGEHEVDTVRFGRFGRQDIGHRPWSVRHEPRPA